MKKKTISVFVALSLLTGTSYTAFADPISNTQQQQIQQNKQKLDDVNDKISEITAKIDALTGQIEPIMADIEKNKSKIEDIKGQIVVTQQDIEKTRADLEKKQEAFGSRMRKIYKSGGDEDYISLIFSSTSLSDLIDKVQAVGSVMKLDKQVISDIQNSKKELDTKVADLQTKQSEITQINEDNQTKVKQLNAKKAEQQKNVDELKEEKKKVVVDLSASEKALIDYPVSIIKNSSSTISQLNTAINMIHSARGSISLPTVDDEAKSYISKAKDIIKQREASQTQSQTQSSSVPVNRGDSAVVSGNASSVIGYAYNFLGTPYVYGATGPGTFDCSGFTSYVYRKFGVNIGRTTYDQINVGTPVSYSELQPGDLVFTRGVEHVGIYVGNGQMIHAPRPGESVKVGPIYQYSSARRVMH